jgi:hypothetical protein
MDVGVEISRLEAVRVATASMRAPTWALVLAPSAKPRSRSFGERCRSPFVAVDVAVDANDTTNR